MESDFRYFSRRAAEERRRAQFAITPEAQERHNELANMFASKAAQRVRLDVLTPLRAE
jgi:Holliday junction resolvase-like predicted endonuclease